MIRRLPVNPAEEKISRVEGVDHAHAAEGLIQNVDNATHGLLTELCFLLQPPYNFRDNTPGDRKNNQCKQGELYAYGKQNGDKDYQRDRFLKDRFKAVDDSTLHFRDIVGKSRDQISFALVIEES